MWIAPGVFELPMGSSVLDAFTGDNALVVSCPGRDMMRVWLLPVERPGFEEINSCLTCCHVSHSWGAPSRYVECLLVA